MPIVNMDGAPPAQHFRSRGASAHVGRRRYLSSARWLAWLVVVVALRQPQARWSLRLSCPVKSQLERRCPVLPTAQYGEADLNLSYHRVGPIVAEACAKSLRSCAGLQVCRLEFCEAPLVAPGRPRRRPRRGAAEGHGEDGRGLARAGRGLGRGGPALGPGGQPVPL